MTQIINKQVLPSTCSAKSSKKWRICRNNSKTWDCLPSTIIDWSCNRKSWSRPSMNQTKTLNCQRECFWHFLRWRMSWIITRRREVVKPWKTRYWCDLLLILKKSFNFFGSFGCGWFDLFPSLLRWIYQRKSISVRRLERVWAGLVPVFWVFRSLKDRQWGHYCSQACFAVYLVLSLWFLSLIQ